MSLHRSQVWRLRGFLLPCRRLIAFVDRSEHAHDGIDEMHCRGGVAPQRGRPQQAIAERLAIVETGDANASPRLAQADAVHQAVGAAHTAHLTCPSANAPRPAAYRVSPSYDRTCRSSRCREPPSSAAAAERKLDEIGLDLRSS